MNTLRNLFNKYPFLKSVTILASGSIISQVILVIAIPLLSRFFSVEEFGYLSVFISISTIIAVFSGGKYELAIGLPNSSRTAILVYNLVINIAMFLSVIYLIAIFIYSSFYSNVNGKVYFLPLYVLLIAIYSAQGYWYQRHKNYTKISIATLLQTVVNVGFSLIFGWVGIDFGLIYAAILGVISSIIYFFIMDRRLFYFNLYSRAERNIAKKYSGFPKYQVFTDFLLTISYQFLPILLSMLYGAFIVGLFSMANRIARIPNVVITAALTNVFRNNAIDLIKKQGDCRKMYISTLKRLLLISIPVYSFICLFSPFLFVFFLGEKWLVAGYFASILSISLMVEFCTIPLNSIFIILNKQRVLMYIQVFNAFSTFFLVYITYMILENIYLSLGIYVFVSIFYNMICIYLSYKYSMGKNEKILD